MCSSLVAFKLIPRKRFCTMHDVKRIGITGVTGYGSFFLTYILEILNARNFTELKSVVHGVKLCSHTEQLPVNVVHSTKWQQSHRRVDVRISVCVTFHVENNF